MTRGQERGRRGAKSHRRLSEKVAAAAGLGNPATNQMTTLASSSRNDVGEEKVYYAYVAPVTPAGELITMQLSASHDSPSGDGT